MSRRLVRLLRQRRPQLLSAQVEDRYILVTLNGMVSRSHDSNLGFDLRGIRMWGPLPYHLRMDGVEGRALIHWGGTLSRAATALRDAAMLGIHGGIEFVAVRVDERRIRACRLPPLVGCCGGRCGCCGGICPLCRRSDVRWGDRACSSSDRRGDVLLGVHSRYMRGLDGG